MIDFKNLIRTILPVGVVALAAVSCRPQVISSDTFEPEFRLVTESFHGGEDFVFRIYSNHKQVILTKYDCEFASDAVVLNKEYSVNDGFCEFRETSVSVEETHRGRVSVTVKDPDTGAEKSFSGTYTAYVPYDNYMRIDNEVVTTSKVNGGFPAVVGGDDFKFTVHSNISKLTLKDFYCEFNDGQLVKGKEYSFDERGNLTFTMKKVKVSEDSFSEPSSVSLTFVDGLSGEDIRLSANYVKLVPFTPSLQVNPTKVTDGGDFKFRITSNRKNVLVASFMTDPDSDMREGGFQPSDLYANQTVQMNADGCRDYVATGISVTSTHNGKLKLVLKDTEYTGREVTVGGTYTASVKPGASNISADATSFSLSQGETRTVRLSTTDTSSDGKYSFEIVSATGSVTCAFDPNDNMKLNITAGDKPGAVIVRAYSTTRPSTKVDISVFVRYRVAVLVKCDIDHSENYSWDQSQKKVGGITFHKDTFFFQDMPTSFTAGLYTWTGKEEFDTYDTDIDKNHSFVKFNNTYNCKATFAILANPGSVPDGSYKFFGRSSWSYGNTKVCDPVTLKGTADTQMADVKQYFRDYNDRWTARKKWSSDFFLNPELAWSKFDLIPYSFDYDKDHLDIRYVIMTYKATANGTPYSGAYWWEPVKDSNWLYANEW